MIWSVVDMTLSEKAKSVLKEIKADACKINGLRRMLAHLERHFVDEDTEKIKCTERTKGQTAAWDDLIDVLKRSDFKAFCDYVEQIFAPDFRCPEEFRSKLKSVCKKYGLQNIFEVNDCSSAPNIEDILPFFEIVNTNPDLPVQNEEMKSRSFGSPNQSFGSFESTTDRPWSSMESNDVFEIESPYQNGAKEKRRYFRLSSKGSNESKSSRISSGSFGSKGSIDEPGQLSVDSLLRSLPTKVRRKLCDALDCKTVIGSNWHHFADHLNLSQAVMQKLEEQNEKMKEIFVYMQQEVMKIGDVVAILLSIQRKDCLQFLKEAGVKGLPDYTAGIQTQLSQPEQELAEDKELLGNADQTDNCQQTISTQETDKGYLSEEKPERLVLSEKTCQNYVGEATFTRENRLSRTQSESNAYSHSKENGMQESLGKQTVDKSVLQTEVVPRQDTGASKGFKEGSMLATETSGKVPGNEKRSQSESFLLLGDNGILSKTDDVDEKLTIDSKQRLNDQVETRHKDQLVPRESSTSMLVGCAQNSTPIFQETEGTFEKDPSLSCIDNGFKSDEVIQGTTHGFKTAKTVSCSPYKLKGRCTSYVLTPYAINSKDLNTQISNSRFASKIDHSHVVSEQQKVACEGSPSVDLHDGTSNEDSLILEEKAKSVLKEIKADACKIIGLHRMLAHLERHFVDEDTEKIKCTERTKGQTAAWDDLIDVLKRSDFKAFCDYVEQIFAPDFPCPEEFRSKLKSVCKKYGLQNIFEVNGCSSAPNIEDILPFFEIVNTNPDLPVQNEEMKNRSFGSPNQSFGSFESTTDRPWSSMESNDVFEIESPYQNGAKEKRRYFRLSSKGSNESKSSRISSGSFGSKGSIDEPGQLTGIQTQLSQPEQELAEDKELLGNADQTDNCQQTISTQETDKGYLSEEKPERLVLSEKTCQNYVGEATFTRENRLSRTQSESNAYSHSKENGMQESLGKQTVDKSVLQTEVVPRQDTGASKGFKEGSMLATETSGKVPGNEKRSQSESFLLLGDNGILSKTDDVDEKLTIDSKQRLNDQVETRHKDQLVPRESSTSMLVGCAQNSTPIFQETEGTFEKDPSLSCIDNGFKSDEVIQGTTHGFKTAKTVSCSPDKLKGRCTSYVLTPYAINSKDLNTQISNSRFASKIDHSHVVSEQQKVACKGSPSVDLHDGTSNEDSLILEEKAKSVLKEIKADACKIIGLHRMLAHLERHFVDEDTEKIKCTERTKGQTAAWDDLIDVLKRSDFKAFCDYVEQIFAPDFPCPEEFRSKLKSVCKKYGLQNIFEVNGCSSAPNIEDILPFFEIVNTNPDLPVQNEEMKNRSFGSPNQSFGSFESTTDRPWSSMESNDVFEIESPYQNGAKEKRRYFRLSSKGSNESKSSRISSGSFGSKGSIDEPGQLTGIQTQLSQPEQELAEDKELLGNADQTDNCQQTISTQETDKGYLSEEKPERLVLSEKTCQNYVGEATFTRENRLSRTQSESNAYSHSKENGMQESLGKQTVDKSVLQTEVVPRQDTGASKGFKEGSMLATETSGKVPGNEKRSQSESFLLLGDNGILSKTDDVDEKLTIDSKQRLNDQVETRHKDQLVPRESSTSMLVGCAQNSTPIFQETEGTFEKDPSLSCIDNGFKSDEVIQGTTHGFKTAKTVSCSPDKLKGRCTSYVLTPYAINSKDLNTQISNSRFASKIDHSHVVSEQQKVACKGSPSVDLHDGTSNEDSLILEEKAKSVLKEIKADACKIIGLHRMLAHLERHFVDEDTEKIKCTERTKGQTAAWDDLIDVLKRSDFKAFCDYVEQIFAPDFPCPEEFRSKLKSVCKKYGLQNIFEVNGCSSAPNIEDILPFFEIVNTNPDLPVQNEEMKNRSFGSPNQSFGSFESTTDRPWSSMESNDVFEIESPYQNGAKEKRRYFRLSSKGSNESKSSRISSGSFGSKGSIDEPGQLTGIQTQLSQPEQELAEDKELLGNADQTDNCQQTISTQETDKGYLSEEKPERLVLSEKTCQNYVGEATFTRENRLSRTQSESNAYSHSKENGMQESLGKQTVDKSVLQTEVVPRQDTGASKGFKEGSMLATETSGKVPGNEKRSQSESFLLLGDNGILSKTDDVDEKLTIHSKQRLNDQVETRHKDQLVPRESST
eukprot:gene3554-2134_t